MRNMVARMSFAAVCWFSLLAAAEIPSGSELLADLKNAISPKKSVESILDQTMLNGYLIASKDAFIADTYVRSEVYCEKIDGFTPQQLAYVVKNWLEKHPEEWSEHRYLLVRLAFKDKFPECN